MTSNKNGIRYLFRVLIVIVCTNPLTVVASGETPVYLDRNVDMEARVEDALARMTLEEKVALCHARSKFSSPGVERLGIPGVMMSDGPHGVRAEINWNDWGYSHWTNDSVTAFPALSALAATWNPELSALYGKCLGEEARYRGKDVLLGPGVNICRTPLNGRNFEYMGEDPYLAGEMVVPYVRELQKNGVAACVKHFALNNQEKWRGTVDVSVSDRALYEIYLPAFRKAVKEGGAWSIMGAYNRIWGEHCCHNSRLLNDILRGEWGFDGVVITDWGGAHDTMQAALNGLDIEMGSYTNGLTSKAAFGYDDYYLARPYLEMIRRGEIDESNVDVKARNILRLIFRTSMNGDRPFGSKCSPEHYAAAKSIGDESIVLLKNNGLLPIDPQEEGSILVVGDNAVRRLTDGGGSSELKPKDYVSPLESLKKIYGERVRFAPGYTCGRQRYGKEDIVEQSVQDSLRKEAVEMARMANVVIYIGGLNKNAWQDCESTDRREYSLPFGQDSLIRELAEVCPRIVIANISGNAYAMPWVDNVDAILHTSYLGTMGGASLADVIAGNVNPSGKLPYSIPVKLEDNGASYFGEISYPGIDSPESGAPFRPGLKEGDGLDPRQEYKEDILVGYRWHDTKKIAPLFPFGHGLSYTRFEYGKPSVSSGSLGKDGKITVTIPVTNNGDRVGSEVVQLYISDLKSTLPRPKKELKGFRKVRLAPGETKEVMFEITPEALSYFDDCKHEWVVEPGKFKSLIGSSSRAIRRTITFDLK